MEKNLFLEVEYDGTNYFGFQIQAEKSNQPTIQKSIEDALFKLFEKKIRINSSGRTDRGVHALAHPLNFKVDTKISFVNIKKALNSFLPSDIKIKKIKKVPLDFQARFQAKTKIYRYLIFNQKEMPVFWRNFYWHFPQRLDLKRMGKASQKITGKRDFSYFAKNAAKYQSCVRDLKNVIITKKKNFIYFDLEADGFLRQMARNIIFFLTQASTEKLRIKEIEMILKREKNFIRKPAPPQGLYLYKVKY